MIIITSNTYPARKDQDLQVSAFVYSPFAPLCSQPSLSTTPVPIPLIFTLFQIKTVLEIKPLLTYLPWVVLILRLHRIQWIVVVSEEVKIRIILSQKWMLPLVKRKA